MPDRGAFAGGALLQRLWGAAAAVAERIRRLSRALRDAGFAARAHSAFNRNRPSAVSKVAAPVRFTLAPVVSRYSVSASSIRSRSALAAPGSTSATYFTTTCRFPTWSVTEMRSAGVFLLLGMGSPLLQCSNYGRDS